MNIFNRALTCFLILGALSGISHPAAAKPPVAPVMVLPQPKATLLNPIAAQLQQLLTPASTSAPAAPVGSSAPAPANAAPAPSDDSDSEPQSYGVKALDLAINLVELVRTQGLVFVSNFAALPQLSSWFDTQHNDPAHFDRWKTVGNDIIVIIGIPLIAAILLELLLTPLRNSLRRKKPSDLANRLLAVLGILFLKLWPVLVFIGASLTLLDQHEPQKMPRFVVLNIIYAIGVSRIAIALIRALTVPTAAALRLIPASTAQAVYAYRWMTAFGLVIIYGYFCVDLARGLRVPTGAIAAFTNLLGLALVVMTLVVIVQKRAFVAALLRGNLSAAQEDLSFFQSMRLWFARNWHILAVAYLIIGYLIAALGVDNGFALMLRGTILTLGILALMRFLFHAIDRWGTRDVNSNAMHHTILRFGMRVVIWVFAVIAFAATWGADIPAFFATPFGQHVLGASFSIGVTVTILTLIYESFNSACERHLNRQDSEGKKIQASARMRTLLPMIRNTAFIIFTVIIALVALSEIGVNIAPLLAGAGIFGVALGFGSQTLVKDFLTGLFIVIENTIAIGDVIQTGSHKGVVEAMSVRTLKLRDNEGALHILPFSEVTQIINMSKDFSYAVINVGVAYHSDLDHVMKVMREVGADLQQDPIFKRVIMEPIEILGVDSLGDSSITIASRMRTRPGKQWDVRRMFLLMVKKRFDKEGIEIPFPTVTNIQKSLPPA